MPVPEKKKPITDLTTEEVVKKLFPKKVHETAKKVACEKDAPRKSTKES
ncbi:MAG: hypothetical protein HY687_02650 [Chloroflexi bacterium]|nr:hypothetical protein [Chloroflexota bacterium]